MDNNPKVNREVVIQFFKDYYETCMYECESLGQAFLNKFLEGHSDPELYYCTNEAKCREIIRTKYVGD